MKVGMIAVNSSFVSRLCWFDQSLIVRMGSNWYELIDVPHQVFLDWLDAPSIGVFYNQKVKGKFLSKPLLMLAGRVS